MNFILFRKELHGLRVFLWLILAFQALTIIMVLTTEFPDWFPYTIERYGNDSDGSILMFVIIGMLIGSQVMIQESAQETQSFLDGLPVSRRAVFLHKSLAAFLLMSLGPVLYVIWGLAMGLISQHSVSDPLPLKFAGAMTLIQILLGFAVVASIMVLSFTRKFLPLTAGLFVWWFVWLDGSKQPWALWFNTNALFSLDVDDAGHLLIPWHQVAGHAAVAVAAWLLCWCIYEWREGRVTQWWRQFSTWRFAGWWTGLGMVLAIVVWFVAIGKLAARNGSDDKHVDSVSRAAGEAGKDKDKSGDKSGDKGKDDDKEEAEVVTFATERTQFYEIVFKESQRDRVMKLKGGMDVVHDQVAAFFGHPFMPRERIVVDVASLIDPHAAGVTTWDKIRIPLNSDMRAGEFFLVLRHETTHVFIEELSQGSASDYFMSMRSFHEGVATFSETMGNDDWSKAERLKVERGAAAADSVRHVELKQLCNDHLLSKERDPIVAYTLGFVFTEALIDTGGPLLPRRIAESLHASPPPPGEAGAALWQHQLQQCGVSFEQVAAAYDKRLKDLRVREETFVGKLPSLSGNVSVEGGEIVIRVQEDTKPSMPGKLVCLVRDDGLGAGDTNVKISKDGAFHIPLRNHAGTTIHYMLGWLPAELGWPVFQPRAEARLE